MASDRNIGGRGKAKDMYVKRRVPAEQECSSERTRADQAKQELHKEEELRQEKQWEVAELMRKVEKDERDKQGKDESNRPQQLEQTAEIIAALRGLDAKMDNIAHLSSNRAPQVIRPKSSSCTVM